MPRVRQKSVSHIGDGSIYSRRVTDRPGKIRPHGGFVRLGQLWKLCRRRYVRSSSDCAAAWPPAANGLVAARDCCLACFPGLSGARRDGPSAIGGKAACRPASRTSGVSRDWARWSDKGLTPAGPKRHRRAIALRTTAAPTAFRTTGLGWAWCLETRKNRVKSISSGSMDLPMQLDHEGRT